MAADPSLSGSVALVTGASSGIGAATARTLAEQGARVALAARRTDRLESLKEEVAGAGGDAIAIEADEEWERTIHLNVLGLMYCANAATPHLLQAAKSGPRGVADIVTRPRHTAVNRAADPPHRAGSVVT